MNDRASEHGRVSRRRFLVTGAVIASGAVGFGVAGPAAFASGGDRRPEHRRGAELLAWFDLARALVQATPGFSPPVAARLFGYLGLTLYEAVAPASRTHRSLQPALADLPRRSQRGGGADDVATVGAAALAEALRLFVPLTAEGAAAVAALEASRPARNRRDVEHGRALAQWIHTWASSDGGHDGHLHNVDPTYVAPVGPGHWVPTAPGLLPPLQPGWGTHRCFALASGTDVDPGPPPAYDETVGSPFWTEAKEVYDTVRALTAEQEAIARFWSDDPGITSTPPGHAVAIACTVLRRERASIMLTAETLAKVGMAVSDAFVACWSTKYRYDLLRPITAVGRLFDPGWQPILTTPPFPEYTSGHSVQMGAACEVLADLFGDDYAFTDHTHDDRGLPARSFASFTACAEEAAISRLYGGIHFRRAIDVGVEQGHRVGRAVLALPFQRARGEPGVSHD